jgi:hypothetical protein
VRFHENRGDIREPVIGFEGLNAYLIVTQQLIEMSQREEYVKHHQKIRRTLDHIEILIDEIISEGYARMHHDEDENMDSD